jgi:hypothetical protein
MDDIFDLPSEVRMMWSARIRCRKKGVLAVRNRMVALSVDKASQQWIVRDPEGTFWVTPSVKNPWDHRQPYHLAEDADLQPVPGHCKPMLGLPF